MFKFKSRKTLIPLLHTNLLSSKYIHVGEFLYFNQWLISSNLPLHLAFHTTTPFTYITLYSTSHPFLHSLETSCPQFTQVKKHVWCCITNSSRVTIAQNMFDLSSHTLTSSNCIIWTNQGFFRVYMYKPAHSSFSFCQFIAPSICHFSNKII